MNGIAPDQQVALEKAVEADPGAACFPALAEAHRRAGRLEDAERVLRRGLERKSDEPAGRLVLGSVLLDQGRVDEARAEFELLTSAVLASQGIQPELVAEPASPPESLSEAELDDAFAQAETDTDELIDPNRVAEAAVAHVDAAADYGLDEASLGDALVPGSAFATATMAELLERQGDETGAERIRAALGTAAVARTEEAPDEGSAKQALVGTLERWLQNVRGDRP